MQPEQSHMQHMRAIMVLGLPLIGSHLAQFAVTLTDAIMLGWYDVEVLAQQVLGGMLFFVLFIMGSGFAWAVMPMVAEAESAGRITEVRRVTRMAQWLSMLFGAAAMPVFWWSAPLLDLAGQQPAVAQGAQDYLRIAGWAIFPALVVMVLKSYLSALERAQVVLWVTVAAVGVNILVNYALIFGNWGAPELGIRGAAIASLAVQGVSALALIVYAALVTPEHALFQRLWRPDWEAFGAVFRLGWPIGITNLAEVGLFGASSLMMGWLGTLPLAAHGIALQITSAMFMVHLGLSNAATVRAGRALGRGDLPGLRRGGKVIIAVSAVMVTLTVVLFVLAPEPLMALFLSPDDPERGAVIVIGVGLLAAAALFQLVDAAQVMALGLLRGVQDTRVPMVIAAFSYWAVGVPFSYVLGFPLGLGGVGVWLGLAIGLALAGVFMMWRFWRISLPRLSAAQAA
ncbi:MATE family efflux transporter [Lutimaribacter sp. EGI FJ00015]|uniref:MATE family efflux transporter n=1 Tax=Lutimaribacter degradans TaxID=2945989 RepID=A0ACC5ZUE4_9RHOB|nr:MATE family efflux transporter [Lutimaribacter sp. EGI FJ00013]MCM2561381.1 MATE family efflux transporter [Lutimaribacter sp. EGI FJ00013]MCO0612909.1 MATE family efflux transporter [Lutimaribacter sp. EGI FJ00015]MCO0635567.1 MATE family efflux transporter [Lutimaribacter sp. EGI FJ00014]